RKLFSQTPESRVRGYLPGRFSFNVKGGRCEACAGDGTIKIEMHFLPDVYVPCEVCKGARYNRDTLDVTFKGKNIAEVLDLSCEEAAEFFANQPTISRHMQTLVDVGLGYVRLGQPAPTLSGGEAQRVKLASELAKKATGHTMYILDEPTTGLHFEDIRKLLSVLSRLVDQGNTVLVIEHNLDVVKTADWIIDLGPEGGDAGGMVITAYAVGLPELARGGRSAILSALAASTTAALAISAVQLVVGSGVLPRFVVFGAAIILVPWDVACTVLATGGRTRAEERDRVVAIVSLEEADALRADLSQAPERPATIVDDLRVDQARSDQPRARPLVESV